MKRVSLRLIVRIALVIGGAIDAFVAILAIFFQPLLGPLLDVPVRDPLLASVAGGETAVVACVYAFIFRDPDRFRPLLYVVALDQVFAMIVPLVAIAHGTMIASAKTLAPIPGNVALAAIFLFAATRLRPAT